VASRQAPHGTRASNRLPVSVDARWTKPVRRAAASMSSDAKKSVHLETALRVHVVMGVSLVWCEAAKGHPSSHLGETSTAHGNSIGYRFMRVPPPGGAKRCPPWRRVALAKWPVAETALPWWPATTARMAGARRKTRASLGCCRTVSQGVRASARQGLVRGRIAWLLGGVYPSSSTLTEGAALLIGAQ
jgi:hypothetical protein